jgi:hypothetical protein
LDFLLFVDRINISSRIDSSRLEPQPEVLELHIDISQALVLLLLFVISKSRVSLILFFDDVLDEKLTSKDTFSLSHAAPVEFVVSTDPVCVVLGSNMDVLLSLLRLNFRVASFLQSLYVNKGKV